MMMFYHQDPLPAFLQTLAAQLFQSKEAKSQLQNKSKISPYYTAAKINLRQLFLLITLYVQNVTGNTWRGMTGYNVIYVTNGLTGSARKLIKKPSPMWQTMIGTALTAATSRAIFMLS